MPVVSSTLQHVGRVHEIGDGAERSNRLKYLVITDDPRDDGWAVYTGMLTASPDPAPAYMARYITSGGATDLSNFARRFRFSQPELLKPTLWEVEVSFEPLPPGRDPTFTQSTLDPAYTPLAEPPHYSLGSRVQARIVEKDRDGKPIVNGAGQPFDEPVEEEIELAVHTVRFNVGTAAEVRALDRAFSRKLNSDPFLGYDPEWLYCTPPRAGDPMVANGIRYFPVTMRLLANDKPWRREYVNRGFKHRIPQFGPIETVLATDPILDENGAPTTVRVPVSEPVLLTDGTEPDEAPHPSVPGPGFRLSDYRPDAVGNTLEFAIDGAVPFTGVSGLPFWNLLPA